VGARKRINIILTRSWRVLRQTRARFVLTHAQISLVFFHNHPALVFWCGSGVVVRSFTAANWLALVASVDELGGWNNRGIQFANVDVSRKLASMTWINQSVAPTPVYTDPLTRTGPEQPITKTEFLAYMYVTTCSITC